MSKVNSGNFRLLRALFQTRFLENDTIGPDSGFETNVYQVLGLLATPGMYFAMSLMPVFMELATQKPGPAADWTVRVQRLFFPTYSFAVTGFATVFQWDHLLPDRRDFLILAPFPIRLRELFAAKFAALGIFLLALIVAVNFFPALVMPVFSAMLPKMRTAGLIRATAAQLGATFGAAGFAFFAVAAFQGVLVNVTSPRIFRKLSPAVQMAGMSLMVLTLLTYPIYSMLLRSMARTHPEWLRLFPPVWFTGLYDLLLPKSDAAFAALGVFGLKALGIAVAIFSASWALGFRRHYRRTLESEDTQSRAPGNDRVSRLIRSPEERAIFDFSGRILARSTVHRLFLATYLSVGVSFGLLVSLVVKSGKINWSQEGLRAFPFLIVFFVISGFRGALQFPAELASNWLFQITESGWAETARNATRKRVLLSGLVPSLIFVLPFELAIWGWRQGLLHVAFQLTAGALLIEVLFWTFEKIPFTCSYFPGTLNLGLLAAIYLYGFTNYSFQMADLEAAVDRDAIRGVLFFAGAAIALTVCRRRHPAASAVRFNASEAYIQTLDLT